MDAHKVLAVGHYTDQDMSALQRDFDLLTNDPESFAERQAAEVAAIAFAGHMAMTGAFMDRFPNLKLISNFGVGYDAIDVAAASERGISVTNTPDVLTDDVADLAVGMLLAISRQIPQADAWVRSGKWATEGAYPLLSKVSGKRAGIVGLGRIGRAIADRLTAFQMPISYSSRAPKETPPGWAHYDSPAAMAAEVDYLIIALAGGPETASLVDAGTIEALGPTGTLVNISRGTTVDEEAMISALQDGRLGAAALDVFLNEPDPDPRFAALPNVLLQPHQASATRETRGAMAQLQRDNITALLAGKPLLTPVN